MAVELSDGRVIPGLRLGRVLVSPTIALTQNGVSVDAALRRAPDGSRSLVVSQGLIERLYGLHARGVGPTWVCFLCGCTDENGCAGGCWWVAGDLCSRCLPIVELAQDAERRDQLADLVEALEP